MRRPSATERPRATGLGAGSGGRLAVGDTRWHGLVLVGLAVACGGEPAAPAPPSTPEACQPSLAPEVRGVPVPEARQACADRDPLLRPLFGDLHVHTRLSFDAYTVDVRTTPAQAYAFARGEEIAVPPLGADGQPSQRVRLARPLDFAAVTDHAEFLGEVLGCTDPAHASYGSDTCTRYRAGGFDGTRLLAGQLSQPTPRRPPDVCEGSGCPEQVRDAWAQVRDAAEAAYDRTSACSFTTLLGYEWTGATGASNLHRNVLFRDEHAPEPISYYDEPTAEGLWGRLGCACEGSVEGCAALAIPHNSNLANGKLFSTTWNTPTEPEARRELWALRARAEPLMEIYQHKGQSECINGLSGADAPADPLCDAEQVRLGQPDCADGIGSLGMIGQGCVSRVDFARGALLAGLAEERALGVNPLQMGFIASTDTHLGVPGATDEEGFFGHLGDETTVEQRLGDTVLTSGVVGNPGGLVGVWAEENSRHAIFSALQRREAWGTSGTRLVPRVFAGFGLPAGLCSAADPVTAARASGAVPMGGRLGAAGGGTPAFMVRAERDPATGAANLERLQLVKGWVDDAGAHLRVLEVASAATAPTVDLATCAPSGGEPALCTVFTDPEFDPGVPSFWYLRVVEGPSCRWSTRQCQALPAAQRPPACADGVVPATVRELGWASPVWYSP